MTLVQIQPVVLTADLDARMTLPLTNAANRGSLKAGLQDQALRAKILIDRKDTFISRKNLGGDAIEVICADI